MLLKKSLSFLPLVILIIASENVLAIGVSPALYTVNFEPNLEATVSFNFNAEYAEQELEVTVDGDLAEYVTLSTNHLSGGGKVDVFLKLPREIEKPGKHRILIGAVPSSGVGGGTVGAVASVKGSIDVIVPFPGKYAEMSFSIGNANAGEDVEYVLTIYSKGKENITASPRIEIYDIQNNSIEIIDIEGYVIPPTTSQEIKRKINTSSYKAGNYKALALVRYDSKALTEERVFRLGELFVDIVNWTEEFEREKINPFVIQVESKWNDPVELFAEVFIVDKGISFLTPSVHLKSFERTELIGYFDTTPIDKDSFQARIVLHYGEEVTEKIVELKLEEKEIDYLLVGMITAGVVLVLLIVAMSLWIIKLRKNVKKKKK